MESKGKIRTAFFGGSFDPVHNGHVELAQMVLKHNLSDMIVFVPSYDPPHKDGAKLSSFEDRCQMVELALAGKKNMTVSRIEDELKISPSYTFDILTALSQRYEQCLWQCLIGADSLVQLHSWHRAGELVKNWPLIVFPRRGETIELNSLFRHWDEETAQRLIAAVQNFDFLDISSTEIRRRLQNNETINDVVNIEVVKYIDNQRLYRE